MDVMNQMSVVSCSRILACQHRTVRQIIIKGHHIESSYMNQQKIPNTERKSGSATQAQFKQGTRSACIESLLNEILETIK